MRFWGKEMEGARKQTSEALLERREQVTPKGRGSDADCRADGTIKDATVKRYFYETHAELRMHLNDFVTAYNFARRLKTLKGLTPYAFICKL
jgi:hypothetical protein